MDHMDWTACTPPTNANKALGVRSVSPVKSGSLRPQFDDAGGVSDGSGGNGCSSADNVPEETVPEETVVEEVGRESRDVHCEAASTTVDVMERKLAAVQAELDATRAERDMLSRDVDLLATRYRSVKDELTHVLFHEMHHQFHAIPPMVDDMSAAVKHEMIGMGLNSERVLWKSAMSEVISVVRPGDSVPLVVKMIRKAACRKLSAVRNLNREITILNKLKHPGIISMQDSWHERDFVCMVFLLENQDLFGLSNDYGRGMPDKYVIQIQDTAAEALAYMHRSGVYHRDLKPENILVTGKGTDNDPYKAVIIDFGISICGHELEDGMTKGLVGSPGFFAPEMMGQSSYSPEKADIWSFGCVILELVVGHVLFKNHWMPIYDRASSSSLESLRSDLQHALDHMLSEQRMHGSKLAQSTTSLLQTDPKLRIHPYSLSERFAPENSEDSFGDSLSLCKSQRRNLSLGASEPELDSMSWGAPELSSSPGKQKSLLPELVVSQIEDGPPGHQPNEHPQCHRPTGPGHQSNERPQYHRPAEVQPAGS